MGSRCYQHISYHLLQKSHITHIIAYNSFKGAWTAPPLLGKGTVRWVSKEQRADTPSLWNIFENWPDRYQYLIKSVGRDHESWSFGRRFRSCMKLHIYHHSRFVTILTLYRGPHTNLKQSTSKWKTRRNRWTMAHMILLLAELIPCIFTSDCDLCPGTWCGWWSIGVIWFLVFYISYASRVLPHFLVEIQSAALRFYWCPSCWGWRI
jgi:hypothetical protein